MAIFTTALLVGGALGLGKGLFESAQIGRKADVLKEQVQFKAGERARQAGKLMARQKVSFMKSGVNLAGSPLQVIEETGAFAQEDVRQIFRTGDIQARNLRRSGQTAIFQGLGQGLMSGATLGM